MILNSGSGNNNSIWGDKGVLEVLDDVGGQVADVVSVTVQLVSQSTLSECGGIDGIIESLISAEMGVKLVALFVFIDTDA